MLARISVFTTNKYKVRRHCHTHRVGVTYTIPVYIIVEQL